MHVLVNAIWYLPLAAVAFGLFYVAWRFGLHLCRVQSKKARLLSLPVFVLLVWAVIQYGSKPSAVYAEAFGFPVAADVLELKSKRFLVGQSGGCYLRFKADESTVRRILSRGLTVMDTNHVSSLKRDPRGRVPRWWKLEELGTNAEFYYATFTNKNSYDWIYEYLAYDPSTRVILFRRNDVD